MPPPRSDKRRFQPVKADILGYESGKSRFTNKDGDWVPSSISPWRNNLTALSQRFNLYFVASKEKVHVYVPAFYTQSLGGNPSLVLSPPPARPNAIGYLDELHPHTINHLIVGDLGTDEVLVLATDTGNIAVYHTGAIARALESYAAKVNRTSVDDGGIRPFFTHWVFESAWGLAIHKAARLIAVSANVPHRVQSEENTAKITVFAFALTSASSDRADDDHSFYADTRIDNTEAEEWLEIDDNEELHRQLSSRDRNLKITLSEHRANIPNIAFVNNHHDRQGKFLFSTDIDGEMKLWRIWDRDVLRSYDFSEYNYSLRSRRGDRDRTDRGWNVVPLDPATFHTTSGIEEFCGEKDPSEYYPSPSGAYLGGQRESYLLNGRAGRRGFLGAQSDTDSEDDFGSDPEIEDDHELEDDEVGGVSLSAVAGQSTLDTVQVFNGDVGEADAIIDDRSEVLEEGVSSRIVDEIVDRIVRIEGRPVSLGGADLQAVLSADRFRRPGSLPVLQDDGSSTMTMTEPASETFEVQEGLFGYAESQQLPSPRSEPDMSMSGLNMSGSTWRSTRPPATTTIPPLPVLHLSGSNLRLTNAPFASLPHFFLTDPCSQHYPDAVSWMYHMERMNMTAYLPEIGLVVAASQTGKIALLTLTRRAETGCLGCRIDCVLPTEEQEKNKERPPAPLLGLAVSPIQGSSSIPNDLGPQIVSEEDESEEEAEDDWATDRTVDGIHQSFDHSLLDLDAVNNPRSDSTDSSTDEDYTRRYQRPASTPLQYPPPRAPPSAAPTTPNTTSSSSRRKTLSPRSHRRQVTSTPSPRQQPTPPSRSTQSSSSRPGSKKLRTNSDIAMSIHAPPRSHPNQRRHRSFPLVTTPWAKTSNVTGNDNDAERRRYRLMLTFYDHTVLSYEIQRCQGRIGLWGSGKSNLGNRDDGSVL